MNEEDLRRGIADEVVEMHTEIGGLSRDTAGLIAARIRDGDEDIRTLVEQRDDARERVVELEAELEAAEAKIDGLTSGIGSQTKRMKSVNDRLADENDELRARVDELERVLHLLLIEDPHDLTDSRPCSTCEDAYDVLGEDYRPTRALAERSKVRNQTLDEVIEHLEDGPPLAGNEEAADRVRELREEILECERCGWEGTHEDAESARTTPMSNDYDITCPVCNSVVG